MARELNPAKGQQLKLSIMKTMNVHLSILAMVFVASVFAQGNRKNDPLSMKDELGLTPVQVKKIEAVHSDYAKQREGISIDKTMSAEEKREVMAKKRREERRKVSDILTDKQRERAGEILAERFPKDERVRTPRLPEPQRKPVPERPEHKPLPLPERVPGNADEHVNDDCHCSCPANHNRGKKKGHYKNKHHGKGHH